MRPAHIAIDKLLWTRDVENCEVGYYDRVEDKIIEIKLKAFLDSEIPYHRIRYLKRKGKIVWNRETRLDDV